jgi:hypothetical protein
MGAQSDAIVASLERQVENAAKALVLEIVANLVAATPVATGWARANWLPSIGSPSTSTAGSPGSVSGGEQQAGMVAVLRFTLAQAVMYVANNVPYITILNYGTSSQAPALFVEYCVMQALLTIQQKMAGKVDLSALVETYRSQVQQKIVAHHVVRAFRALKGLRT